MIDDIYLLSEYDLMLGHKRYYDLETIKKDIEKSQLRILEIKGLMLKPITNNQMNLLNFNTNIYSALLDIGENYPEIANCIYIKATI
ncbi:MAG: hypothetical protein KatS3mg028_1289 [Bacteroidia bacterium]|nr:MAG: hypothetical protein KatS3mg028_1289 [Bacteroidia bacterium]